MKLIEQSVKLEDNIDKQELLQKIERAGRTCYKSEGCITKDSASKFIQRIIKAGHLSVIEHGNITLRIVCDRGVSHELVRHRIASYSQESTRYCNYGNDKFNNELKFVMPIIDKKHNIDTDTYMREWEITMSHSEKQYINMVANGILPEYARQILPNSLATEIVVTMNLRNWRHFLELRMGKTAHPQIRDVAFKVFDVLNKELPEIFGDLVQYRD